LRKSEVEGVAVFNEENFNYGDGDCVVEVVINNQPLENNNEMNSNKRERKADSPRTKA
jgi:hypothetical protein